MPILLVPSNYSSATQTVSAPEAIKKEGEDILVLTSMGEVSSHPSFGFPLHRIDESSTVEWPALTRSLVSALADATALVRPLRPRQAQSLMAPLVLKQLCNTLPSRAFTTNLR
jgi:hypothetical protein